MSLDRKRRVRECGCLVLVFPECKSDSDAAVSWIDCYKFVKRGLAFRE